MMYDTMLLVGVLFVAAIPLAAMDPATRAVPWVRFLIQCYLFGVCFAYFTGFWRFGGQTLGMRAWRLRLVPAAPGPVRAWRLALRFAGALLSWVPLGAGYLWVLFRRDRMALHDRLSGTCIVHENA